MTKTRRERFFLWIEQYEAFKAIADEKDISASELLREAVHSFNEPDDHPKKARNLTIDPEISSQIQAIADKWFNTSESKSSGNRSDTVQYIIDQYLKESK